MYNKCYLYYNVEVGNYLDTNFPRGWIVEDSRDLRLAYRTEIYALDSLQIKT